MARPILLTALALLASTPAAAATLHVDGASVDPIEDGSVDHPFHTIGAAVGAAASGDEVQIAAGDYPESVTVAVSVTVVGAPDLGTRIVPTGAGWTLSAIGIEVRSLLFDGTTAAPGAAAVTATRPFTLEACQIQDRRIGVKTQGVDGAATVRHNRILNNRYGLVLYDSGDATYVLVENNLIVGVGGGLGVYAGGTRWRAKHNLISNAAAGIYHRRDPGEVLPISYVWNNLITDVTYGVYGNGVQAWELVLLGNSLDALVDTSGLVSANEYATIHDGCDAPADLPSPPDFAPGGGCVDGGLFGADPDGSAFDIGPYGGPEGGSWGEGFACVGPHLTCPAPTNRGVWAWDWKEVQTAAGRADVVAFANEHGVTRVYLESEALVQDDPASLSAFVELAGGSEIEVTLLFGAPEWALDAHHDEAVALADAAGAFAASLLGAAPVGVQFDVEPYLLEEWDADSVAVGDQYLGLLEELGSTLAGSGLTLEAAIPFWFDEHTSTYDGSARPLSELVLDRLDSAVVMAYRDTAGAMVAFSASEVAYAEQIGRPLTIAAETNCISPAVITFCEEGAEALEEALAEVAAEHDGNAGFWGTAVHDRIGWASLSP